MYNNCHLQHSFPSSANWFCCFVHLDVPFWQLWFNYCIYTPIIIFPHFQPNVHNFAAFFNLTLDFFFFFYVSLGTWNIWTEKLVKLLVLVLLYLIKSISVLFFRDTRTNCHNRGTSEVCFGSYRILGLKFERVSIFNCN